MAIAVAEYHTSREQQANADWSQDFQVREYRARVTGADRGLDCKIRLAIQDASPATVDLNDGTGQPAWTLYRQQVYIRPVSCAAVVEVWEGTVRYGPMSETFIPSGAGGFSLDTGGGTQHIVQALEHLADYGQDAPDTGGALGVLPTGEVQGVDIPVKAFPFQKVRYLSVADFTTAFLAACYALTKCYNSQPITLTFAGAALTFAAGELFLDRVTLSYQQGDLYLPVTFSLIGQPNRTNFSVGGITVAAKRGWDLMTVDHEDSIAASGKAFDKLVKAVHIDRVFEPGDFSVLGLA